MVYDFGAALKKLEEDNQAQFVNDVPPSMRNQNNVATENGQISFDKFALPTNTNETQS